MCSSVRAAFLSGVIDRLARRNERIRPLKLTELRVLSWDDGCRGSLLAFSLFFPFFSGNGWHFVRFCCIFCRTRSPVEIKGGNTLHMAETVLAFLQKGKNKASFQSAARSADNSVVAFSNMWFKRIPRTKNSERF